MGGGLATPGIKGAAGAAQSRLSNGVKSHDAATNGDTKQNSAEPQPPTTTTSKDPQAASQAAKLEKLKQRVTITKDGKKRIAPLLVSNSNAGETSLPRAQLRAAS